MRLSTVAMPDDVIHYEYDVKYLTKHGKNLKLQTFHSMYLYKENFVQNYVQHKSGWIIEEVDGFYMVDGRSDSLPCKYQQQ